MYYYFLLFIYFLPERFNLFGSTEILQSLVFEAIVYEPESEMCHRQYGR